MKHYVIFALIVVISGCSNPKATVVPTTLEKMESIKPVIDKLSPDEKELFGKYLVRHTVGYAMAGMFGIKSDPIPEGMTIGKAIEEQRGFAKKQEAVEKEEMALQAKHAIEQEKAMGAMREAVSVTIMGKKINAQYGSSGIVMDEFLSVKFGYQNNTDKEISGVKGTIEVVDQFGDPLTAFNVSNDESIAPGHVVVWSGGRSVQYGLNEVKDRKFAELSDEKYRIIWKPSIIVFADGTKMGASSLTD